LFLSAATISGSEIALLTGETFLRAGEKAEWSEFADRAPAGVRLDLTFQLAEVSDSTLFIRQTDVKQSWDVEVNGARIGTLHLNESALVHALPVEAKYLRVGANQLSILPPKQPDDIVVSGIVLVPGSSPQIFGGTLLRVRVTDAADDARIPCRVTVTEPDGTLAALQSSTQPGLAVRPGVAYSVSGTMELGVRPGRYIIHAGRGFEYGVARREISVTAGATASVGLQIAREVNTSGHASADTHIHTFTFSRHGDATLEERIATLAGENVELAIATEHNLHADFSVAQRQLRAERWFTPVVGNEVTTQRGHFNAFPAHPESRVPDFRITDWPALIQSIRATPQNKVVILNHPEDLHSEFRPFASTNLHPVTGRSLNGREIACDALELINSGALQSDLMLPFRHWFALLNHGHRVTGVAGSDSHDVARFIVGQGRTYVAIDDRTPGGLDIAKACESILSGKAVMSLGLFATIAVDGAFGPGDLVTRPGTPAQMRVRVVVQAPSWIRADRLELFLNGERLISEPLRDESGGEPGFRAVFEANIPRPKQDVHCVAIATGPGVTESFWPIPKPYQASSPDWTPRVLGATNPVWIDGDGDGRFTPPRAHALALLERTGREPEKVIAGLAPFDRAVAEQAADLLSVANVDLRSPSVQRALQSAPPQVREGFRRVTELLPAQNPK
jgi:hypothetical protein